MNNKVNVYLVLRQQHLAKSKECSCVVTQFKWDNNLGNSNTLPCLMPSFKSFPCVALRDDWELLNSTRFACRTVIDLKAFFIGEKQLSCTLVTASGSSFKNCSARSNQSVKHKKVKKHDVNATLLWNHVQQLNRMLELFSFIDLSRIRKQMFQDTSSLRRAI